MIVEVVNIIDEKTAKVVSKSYKKHPKYDKYITRHKNYLVAQNPDINLSIGDKVNIKNVKPVSKCKTWAIVDKITNN